MAKKAVFGIVTSHEQAERVVDALNRAGVMNQDISVLFPDREGTRDFAHEKNTKAPEGAVIGGGTVGAIGGAIGLLAGLGSIAVPGLGLFLAAGPLLGALGGAAIGAGVGGIAGALVGMGIPELEAKQYEGKLKAGNILISVHTEDGKRVDQVKDLFRANAVESVSASSEANVPKERDTRKSRAQTAAERRSAEAETVHSSPPRMSPPVPELSPPHTRMSPPRMSPPIPSAPHQ